MFDWAECCKDFLWRIARLLIFVGSCKEFVRRIAKYPNMQSAIRSLLRELVSNQICRVL